MARKIIKKYMLNELNTRLDEMECSFHIEFQQGSDGEQFDFCQAAPKNSKFIHSFILNTTSEFKEWLIAFFKKYDIELLFNADRTTFWAKHNE